MCQDTRDQDKAGAEGATLLDSLVLHRLLGGQVAIALRLV